MVAKFIIKSIDVLVTPLLLAFIYYRKSFLETFYKYFGMRQKVS